MKLLKKTSRMFAIIGTGVLSLCATIACTVSTMAWYSHLNTPITGVVESGTPELAIESVTGYKKINDIVESMDADLQDVVNDDQGTADTAFDVPSGGVGYYLVPKVADEYKYSNAGTVKFTEYDSGTRAYVDCDLTELNSGTSSFQIRKYTFGTENQQTITLNEPFDFSAAGSIYGTGLFYVSLDKSISLSNGAHYKLWLDYSNVTLGAETLASIESGFSNQKSDEASNINGLLAPKTHPRKADTSSTGGMTFYLDTSGFTSWEGGARFAVIWSSTSGGGTWLDMTKEADHFYKVKINGTDVNYIDFVRMNGGTSANNWDNKWNDTGYMQVSSDPYCANNVCRISGWDNSGSWSGIRGDDEALWSLSGGPDSSNWTDDKYIESNNTISGMLYQGHVFKLRYHSGWNISVDGNILTSLQNKVTNVQTGSTSSSNDYFGKEAGADPNATVLATGYYTFTLPSNYRTYSNKTYDISITYTPTYTVTWKNGDSVIETDNDVLAGTSPTYNGSNPTKAATAQYTYTFDGWSTSKGGSKVSLDEVTSDITYWAHFSSTVNNYTIRFLNYDGTELQSSSLAYGSTPSYTGTPVKPSTNTKEYTFVGWSPTIAKVTKAQDYTAQFDESDRVYSVTLNTNGGTINAGDLNSYTCGTGATLPSNVTRSGYKFEGWYANSDLETGGVITSIGTSEYGDKEYWAKWRAVNTITVTWKNHDGTVLETDNDVPEEDMPTYNGSTPTKVSMPQYSYSFSGWSPAITVVASDSTDRIYTAQFNSTERQYTIKWKNENGTELYSKSSVLYSTATGSGYATSAYAESTPTKASTPQYSYTFDSWSAASVDSENSIITFTAAFSATTRTYTVSVVVHGTDSYGTVDKSSVASVPYGTELAESSNTVTINGTVVTATPSADDAQWDNSFSSWDNGTAMVTGDLTVTAHFTRTLQVYTVTIAVDSTDKYGTVDKALVASVPYGTELTESSNTVTINGTVVTATPSADDEQWDNSFSYWDNGTATVTGDLTVTAHFTRVLQVYTVTVSRNNASYGTVSQSSVASVPYGTSYSVSENVLTVGETDVTATPANQTEQYVYSFASWSSESGTIVEAITITANFNRGNRIYTITLNNGSGTGQTSVTSITYNNDLPSVFAPTYADHVFLGYFSEANGAGDAYYNFDGTSAHIYSDNSITTLYAYWGNATNSTYYQAGQTYYLTTEYASNWRIGDERLAVYLFDKTVEPNRTVWIGLTSLGNNLHSVTVPYGQWNGLIWVRLNGGTSGYDWSYKWNQTDDLLFANTGGSHFFKVYNVVSGNNNGDWFNAITNGQKLLLTFNNSTIRDNWIAANAVTALKLHTGSSDTYVVGSAILDNNGDVDSYLFAIPSSPSAFWLGLNFLRVNPSSYAGHESAPSDWSMFDVVEPSFPGAAMNAYKITANDYSSGTWVQKILKDDGWYIVGRTSATVETCPENPILANGGNGWNLEGATLSQTPTWDGVFLPGDEFKIVKVTNFSPVWYGYRSTLAGTTNASALLTNHTDNGNITFGANFVDLVAAVDYNEQAGGSYVMVRSYAYNAAIKGYSSTRYNNPLTLDTGTTSITVNIDYSNSTGYVSSISDGGSQTSVSNYSFVNYSATAAYGASPISANSITAGTAIYAIYNNETIVITFLASDGHSGWLTAEELTIDKGEKLNTYGSIFNYESSAFTILNGSNAGGYLYAFKPDSSDQNFYTGSSLSGATQAKNVAINSNTTLYIKTSAKDLMTFYVDTAWAVEAWDNRSNLWTAFYATDTNGNEYFHASENASWKIAPYLYKITMPTDWDFCVATATGQNPANNRNYSVDINSNDTGSSSLYVVIQPVATGNRHGRVWSTNKASLTGTATIYLNGVSTGKTLSYADGTTNYFMLESGLEVNKGDSLHVVVANSTASPNPNGTYNLTNYIGYDSSASNDGLPWFLRPNDTDNDNINVRVDNTLGWEDVYAYAWDASDESVYNAAWPGVKMTPNVDQSGNYTTYYLDIDSTLYSKVIFNNGFSGLLNQTGNENLTKNYTYTINKVNDRTATTSTATVSGTGDVYSATNARFNFYLFYNGTNSKFEWSLAAVPSLGNGFYIMHTSDNNNSTDGYNGALKMITDANGNGASYSHYHVTESTTIYLRSYISGRDRLMTVGDHSIAAVGASAGAYPNSISLAAGYYSVRVDANVVLISGFEQQSFFSLNGYPLGTGYSIYNAQTALVLEVQTTLVNNAPMVVGAKVTNSIGTFVGYKMKVSNSKLTYDEVRGEEASYLTGFVTGDTVAASGTVAPSSERLSDTIYVYILIDYVDVSNANFLLNKYKNAVSFVLTAIQPNN